MNSLKSLFSSYQRTAMIILIAVLAIAIPLTLGLVGQRQDIRQRALEIPGTDLRVFATSSRHTGDFGGILAADAICQQRAQEATLSGVFKAWLSDTNTDAKSRVSDARYVRMDGALIATNSSDLLDESLANKIEYDEKNQKIENDKEVWTGTKKDGTRSDKNCSNWTDQGEKGIRGKTDQKDNDWTDDDSKDCDKSYRIYCFEQPLPVTSTTSPTAQVTSTPTSIPTGTPSATPTPLPSEYHSVIDFNDDGKIDELDLNILYSGFSKRKGD